MGSTFKFTSSVTFDGDVSDGNGTNSSTTCVTKASTLGILYGFHTVSNFDEGNMSCVVGAIAAEITVGVNTLSMTNNHCNHLLTFQGTSANIDAYMLEADGTLVANVGDSPNATDQIRNGVTGCETGTANGITRIQGIMPLDLKITADTAGIQISYNNTRGLSLDMGNSNVMDKFDSAFFDFTLSAL